MTRRSTTIRQHRPESVPGGERRAPPEAAPLATAPARGRIGASRGYFLRVLSILPGPARHLERRYLAGQANPARRAGVSATFFSASSPQPGLPVRLQRHDRMIRARAWLSGSSSARSWPGMPRPTHGRSASDPPRPSPCPIPACVEETSLWVGDQVLATRRLLAPTRWKEPRGGRQAPSTATTSAPRRTAVRLRRVWCASARRTRWGCARRAGAPLLGVGRRGGVVIGPTPRGSAG
jgi:hypothetical protein